MIKRTFADIPIYDFDEIDSTNKYGLENLNAIKSDFLNESTWVKAVVTARQQTDGKGRRDRQWVSEPDSALLASFIIEPKFFGTMLDTTLLITCVNKILNGLNVPSKVKWPNDITVETEVATKKLSGVLTQIAGDYLVIGVGINIKTIEHSEIADVACLNDFEVQIDRDELLKIILNEIVNLKDSDYVFEHVLEKYKSMSSTLGRQVRIESMNETIEGKAIDIAITGSLVIEMPDGRVVELSEGDVIHLR